MKFTRVAHDRNLALRVRAIAPLHLSYEPIFIFYIRIHYFGTRCRRPVIGYSKMSKLFNFPTEIAAPEDAVDMPVTVGPESDPVHGRNVITAGFPLPGFLIGIGIGTIIAIRAWQATPGRKLKRAVHALMQTTV